MVSSNVTACNTASVHPLVAVAIELHQCIARAGEILDSVDEFRDWDPVAVESLEKAIRSATEDSIDVLLGAMAETAAELPALRRYEAARDRKATVAA